MVIKSISIIKGSLREKCVSDIDVHVKVEYVEKSRKSCPQRLSAIHFVAFVVIEYFEAHRKCFISKYDTLICKWICSHTTRIIAIRDRSLGARCVLSTADGLKNGRKM